MVVRAISRVYSRFAKCISIQDMCSAVMDHEKNQSYQCIALELIITGFRLFNIQSLRAFPHCGSVVCSYDVWSSYSRDARGAHSVLS